VEADVSHYGGHLHRGLKTDRNVNGSNNIKNSFFVFCCVPAGMFLSYYCVGRFVNQSNRSEDSDRTGSGFGNASPLIGEFTSGDICNGDTL
jgi:hypothetical protein